MTAQSQASEIPDAQLPRPGHVVGGKYRIDGFIARGGMGAVLAATHQITGRRVALKWMLPQVGQDAEATHRVVREARAAARVRHPNVVDVYDVGEHDGAMFLVMELLEGETLHARLKREGALDPRATLTLLLPAMRGVEAAHQNSVIHRDLKPSNIFLCREHGASEPTPRVLDFGISKILSTASDGEHSLTRTGAVLGTPHYMPAEQLTGGDADETADVYALGVMLYQCLTGRLPFEETNYNALVMQIGTATPPMVAELAPHVPAGLSAVVMRAMARERGDRFQNVGALTEALVPFSAETVARKPPRGAQLWTVALATCVLAAIVAWASQRAKPREPASEVASPSTESTPTQDVTLVVARPATLPTVASQVEPAAPQVEAVQVEPPVRLNQPEATPAPAPQTAAEIEIAGERPRARRSRPAQKATGTATALPTALPDTPSAIEPVPVSLEQF